MKLTDINLNGLGRFCAQPAGFRCERYHLPGSWDYVYTNGNALLRVQHDGSAYLQIDPPTGTALFRVDRGASAPSLMTWLIPEDGTEQTAFTNFWLPTVPAYAPGTEPEEYTCTFAPDAARFRLRHDDWLVETELWTPPTAAAVVMTVSVTNAAATTRCCRLMPVLNPYLAPFSLAPWDRPELYQSCALCRVGDVPALWMETRSPQGVPAQRLRAVFVSDLNPTRFEVARDEFDGAGQWHSPRAVWDRRLSRRITKAAMSTYGKITPHNAAVGRPIMAGLQRSVKLRAGAKHEFTVVFGKLPDTADGTLPPRRELTKLTRLLRPEARKRALKQNRQRYEKLFSLRKVETPDEALNRYVTEWLPLQLEWVNLLDHGWPTGVRGTRDAAQDAAGIVALNPEIARNRIVETLSVQRTDGWFPRQYSTAGPDGEHDQRGYVDAGMWVWELARDYLCFTRDFGILKRKLRWLDTTRQATVLEHLLRVFAYYLAPTNIGEHGLCKIREGDWNDSVNAAGLEGRGETVMVTCQLTMALEQAAELLAYLGTTTHKPTIRRFRTAATRLRANLLQHARNRQGYFNGVFNDAGNWIFSPNDPDGKPRINGPANSFAVIAGIVCGRERDKVFAALNRLRGPFGWRLFYPGIGVPPIANLGRIGQGDLVAGLGENATCYNHGAHGFLGRAAWTAGRGGMLYEILRHMLPYDQRAHPVTVAKTPPYAMVNHWKEVFGQHGVGGDTFLSGSISTALRNCYRGLVGFRPGLEQLVIDPVIPAGWKYVNAEVGFLDARYRIRIRNPHQAECGVAELCLDGEAVSERINDKRLARTVAALPMSRLKRGVSHVIDVELG